jgi:hypothetical protein
MHILEFPDTEIKRYIPENLSECNDLQYINMCQMFFLYQSGEITKEEMLNNAVYILMNMKAISSQSISVEPNTNIILIQELIESTFFEKMYNNPENSEQYQLKLNQNYHNNPVPKFKPLWKTYYGPTDGFMNLKFGEYCEALRTFLEFNSTGNTKLLYDLAAILYRPKKAFHFIRKNLSNYDGDIRVKYNMYQTESRAIAFKQAPIGFVYGVYLFFASMQIFVSGAEVPWGDKTLDLSILFKNDGQSVDIEAQDIGLDSVVFAMAESGGFGNFEKVQNTPFWTIMIKMYDARIKELQLQKQQENAESSTT